MAGDDTDCDENGDGARDDGGDDVDGDGGTSADADNDDGSDDDGEWKNILLIWIRSHLSGCITAVAERQWQGKRVVIWRRAGVGSMELFQKWEKVETAEVWEANRPSSILPLILMDSVMFGLSHPPLFTCEMGPGPSPQIAVVTQADSAVWRQLVVGRPSKGALCSWKEFSVNNSDTQMDHLFHSISSF